VRVTLWGTRGSLPSAGPETVRYGGNTACVEVRGCAGTVLILDAGTGLRRLGAALPGDLPRVDILLTHLHLDHLQGLGFFPPLFREGTAVHIWGPPSTTQDLRTRLARYLSPPLFPMPLRDVPGQLVLHDLPLAPFALGEFEVDADLVCHPGPTAGLRIAEDGAVLAYLPDHEPALCSRHFPDLPEWTSGYGVAAGADLLIHDAQYTAEEYAQHVGWGHSAFPHALAFARLAGVRRLMTFHHDPAHADDLLDALMATAPRDLPFELLPGREGTTVEVGPRVGADGQGEAPRQA